MKKRNNERVNEIGEKPTDILGTLLGETEPLSEKIIYETSKHLFDVDKILMIADLSIEQINYYWKLIIIDELFYQYYCTDATKKPDILQFKHLFEKLLQLTISKNRQSRREIVDMFKILRVEAEAEKRRGFLSRR